MKTTPPLRIYFDGTPSAETTVRAAFRRLRHFEVEIVGSCGIREITANCRALDLVETLDYIYRG